MTEKPEKVERVSFEYSNPCLKGNIKGAAQAVKNIFVKEAIPSHVYSSEKLNRLTIRVEESYLKRAKELVDKAIYTVPELNDCMRRLGIKPDSWYFGRV
jgi:hypothetical protein